MYQGEDGIWHLAFRVANMRQHQVGMAAMIWGWSRGHGLAALTGEACKRELTCPHAACVLPPFPRVQVLQPEVRMLLLRRTAAHPFTSVHWEFVYSELKTEVRLMMHYCRLCAGRTQGA